MKCNSLKYSQYNYDFQFEDAYYIFNFKTGGLVSFDDEKKILSLKNNDLDSLNNDEKMSLVKIGFLVDEENEFLNTVRENETRIKAQKNLNLTIFTTTGCNAKCDYCFEKGVKKESMTLDVADSIVDFLAYNSIDDVSLNWFGGEPLVNSNVISYIIGKLITKGIRFKSSITTNGFLVNDCIEILKKANTKNAQITLDGVFTKYDKIKKFSFPHAFERIISNIKLLLNEKIRVSIRLNFDKNNIKDILETIDYLSGAFSNKEKELLTVYGHHIFENCVEEDLTQLYSAVDNKLFEKGFIRSIKELGINRKYSFCGIDKIGFLSIMPNGKVFRCEHYASDDIRTIGNIYDLKQLNEDFEKTRIPAKCKKCIVFPSCGGGCDYYNSNNESFDGCSPIKYCYENLLKKMIIIKRRKKQ